MKALVIGASGILGSKIVEFLSKNIEVKAAYRDLSKAVEKQNVESVYFDYEDKSSFDPALDGVDRVLLMAPPLDFAAYEKLNPVVQKLQEKGIKKVVLISAIGMDMNDEAPLRKIELELINNGFDYVILRPNFFMEGFSVGGFSYIQQTGELVLNAADGLTSFISAVDIAKVVAKVMIDETFNKKAFTLTGKESLSMGEVVSIIGKKLDKEIKYTPVSNEKMKELLLSANVPASNADFLIMLLDFAAKGFLSSIGSDVKTILGEEPMSFESFVSRYM